MSILDPVRRETTAQDSAKQIRQLFGHTVRRIELSLTDVREIVIKHGRRPVEKALGGDASQLASLYSALKTLVEKAKPGTTIEDLPT